MLCLLFSICVILLSVRPCCADQDCVDDCKTSAQHASTTAKNDDCKGCSPFFSCGTCAGFALIRPQTLPASPVLVKIASDYPAYRQPSVKEVSLSIWQPPQLG